MRSALRKERHRRLRNTDCTHHYHHLEPQVFDRLEYLTQRLNYALPDNTISQVIITTDNYLGYTLNRYLFSGKRTAVFSSLESPSRRLEETGIRQLIVDMAGLAVSCYETLERLRLLIRERSDIRVYLLVPDKDVSLTRFMQKAGKFYILQRRQNLSSLRNALLSPSTVQNTDGTFSHTDWKIISALSQGMSLKEIALLLNTPYHRVIYRLNQLITQLDLPHRHSLLYLIHRLSVTSLHLI